MTLDLDMGRPEGSRWEPPVVLGAKALNQLDKRAKTRKLARRPRRRRTERGQHREKQAAGLRNAQTKVRKQKRAKARGKLAA